MLALLLALQVVDLDGGTHAGTIDGTLRFKTAWGRVDVPLAEFDRVDISPVREADNVAGYLNRALEMADSEKDRAEGEKRLVRLGAVAADFILPMLDVALGERAQRLWTVHNNARARGMPPLADAAWGPSISIRGWIETESFTLDGAKRRIDTTRSFTRAPRPCAGSIVVRMTDGTLLYGKFGKGILKVGTAEVALDAIRILTIQPGGKARVEHAKTATEGKVAGESIPFETSFGTLDLPLKHVGAAMRADWLPFEAPKVDAQGYIRDWLVYGNVAMENDNFEANHLDALDEAAVVPSPDETMFERAWKAYASPRTDVSILQALPKERADQFVAYGAVYVRVPKATTCTMQVQSDDGVRVWLNGVLVHSHHIHRGVDAPADQVAVTLQAGWNRLLVKIDNGWGPSGWRVRFVGASENPMPDLSLKPPPLFLGR
jgi:hypothetical protein